MPRRSISLPKPVAAGKYHAKGPCHANIFLAIGLPEWDAELLAGGMNAAIADSTKATYRTAVNHIPRAEKAVGVRVQIPFDLTATCAYISYLLHHKGLLVGTVESYLSGIRMEHLARGHWSPFLRPDTVNYILKGNANIQAMKKREEGRRTRLPVTPSLLRTIKTRLRQTPWSLARRRALWLAATLAWHGALRVGEVLSRNPNKFDPTKDLLDEDLNINTMETPNGTKRYITVNIRHPKEERLSSGVKIEIFETSGEWAWICPVRALIAYRAMTNHLTPNRPAILLESGACYTPADLNADLKFMLKDIIDYTKNPVTSHSFRAGLATTMAAAKYSDAEIMTAGRWKSNAFLAYVKAPRHRRAFLAEEIHKRLLCRGPLS